jgi:hypothetical protein
MDKFDRLGWAAGFSFVAYGVRIGIRVNNPDVLDRIHGLLPPGWKPARPPRLDRVYSLLVGSNGTTTGLRRFSLLYADATRLVRTMDLDQLLQRLEFDVHLFVAEMARRRVFVHAGVIGWRGRAIIIPGRSFSGKTALVAALVRAGATYYSDDQAVLDAQGRVHPFPTALSIRDESGKLLRRCAPDTLGGSLGVKPLPVGLVVVTTYKSGARWRPRRLSPGQAVLALLANTVSARRQPKAALTMLQQVASHAVALKGVRGEAEEMVGALLTPHVG